MNPYANEPPGLIPEGNIDLEGIRSFGPNLDRVGRLYFRYEMRGMHRVPEGGTLIAGNHSGGKLPIDMFLFGIAWHQHFDYQRPVYTLAHDILFKGAPWLTEKLRSIGVVQACTENADLLLTNGQSLLVLPGGEYETYRPYSERNKIDFNNRHGWIRVALRNRAPISPLVGVGGHEMFFILSRGSAIAKMLGLERFLRVSSFPISLGFPAGVYLGPVPQPFPLPAKITLELLDPIYLHREEEDHPAYTPEDADDREKTSAIYRLITSRMQVALHGLAKERKYPILG